MSYRHRRLAGNGAGLLAAVAVLGLLSLAFRTAGAEDKVAKLAEAQAGTQGRPAAAIAAERAAATGTDLAAGGAAAAADGGGSPRNGSKPQRKRKPAGEKPAPAKPPKQNGYRSFATATGLYIPESDPLKTGRKAPASSLSQSAAGAAIGTSGLKTTDLFGERLISSPLDGVLSYARGAIVSGGALPDAGDEMRAEATATAAPPKVGSDAELYHETEPTVNITHPEAFAAPAPAIGRCDFGTPIARGATTVAGSKLLDFSDPHHADGQEHEGNPLIAFGGPLDSISTTRLVPGKQPGRAGIVSSAEVRLPSIRLFPGTPAEIEIRVRTPMRMEARADGTAGGAKYTWEPIDPDLFPALVPEVYVAGKRLALDLPQLYPGEHAGLAMPLGYDGYVLFGGFEQTIAKTGTSIATAADFITIRLPDPLGDPSQIVYGPLITGLYFLDPTLEQFEPIEHAIAPLLESVDRGMALLRGTGVLPKLPRFPDIRLGHVETGATVPAGGIPCR